MVTKMKTNKRKYKQYQPAEKVAILREHLIEKISVADICDKYGLSPSIYYRWQKQFFEEGEKAFASSNNNKKVAHLEQEIERLETKLTKKDEVLGEVMEEYVQFKKSSGKD